MLQLNDLGAYIRSMCIATSTQPPTPTHYYVQLDRYKSINPANSQQYRFHVKHSLDVQAQGTALDSAAQYTAYWQRIYTMAFTLGSARCDETRLNTTTTNAAGTTNYVTIVTCYIVINKSGRRHTWMSDIAGNSMTRYV